MNYQNEHPDHVKETQRSGTWQPKKKKKKWLFFLLFFVWVNIRWKKEMVADLESTSLSPTPKIYPVNDTPSSGAGM